MRSHVFHNHPPEEGFQEGDLVRISTGTGKLTIGSLGVQSDDPESEGKELNQEYIGCVDYYAENYCEVTFTFVADQQENDKIFTVSLPTSLIEVTLRFRINDEVKVKPSIISRKEYIDYTFYSSTQEDDPEAVVTANLSGSVIDLMGDVIEIDFTFPRKKPNPHKIISVLLYARIPVIFLELVHRDIDEL